MVSRKASRHTKPWGKWATIAEEHVGFRSCQTRTGIWGTGSWYMAIALNLMQNNFYSLGNNLIFGNTTESATIRYNTISFHKATVQYLMIHWIYYDTCRFNSNINIKYQVTNFFSSSSRIWGRPIVHLQMILM